MTHLIEDGVDPKFLQEQVGHLFSDGGWVHLQPHKILGLFPTTKATIRDPRARKELLDRVNTALHQARHRPISASAGGNFLRMVRESSVLTAR